MRKSITINRKACELMKPYKNPKYGDKTVLVDSVWEYVSLYLKRGKECEKALFYWEQAKNFYKASCVSGDDARPLTDYYCALNAAKALLVKNGVSEGELNKHGVHSNVDGRVSKLSLDKVKIKLQDKGVFKKFDEYYNAGDRSSLGSAEYSASDLLYNTLCVHRAYCITMNRSEIFLPIERPTFVRKETGDKKGWVQFALSDREERRLKDNKNVKGIERDIGVDQGVVYRFKRRFNWDIHESITARKQGMGIYHTKIRDRLYYIASDRKLWYLKVAKNEDDPLAKAKQPLLIFPLLHWLSELVRYNPRQYQLLRTSKYNWLLHEFLSTALDQFIDEISCEITGNDIMCTGIRSTR